MFDACSDMYRLDFSVSLGGGIREVEPKESREVADSCSRQRSRRVLRRSLFRALFQNRQQHQPLCRSAGAHDQCPVVELLVKSTLRALRAFEIRP